MGYKGGLTSNGHSPERVQATQGSIPRRLGRGRGGEVSGVQGVPRGGDTFQFLQEEITSVIPSEKLYSNNMNDDVILQSISFLVFFLQIRSSRL